MVTRAEIENRAPATRITDHLPGRIRRASRAVALALWLHEADARAALVAVLAARLQPSERAALAFAAFQSLGDEEQAAFLAHVHMHGRAAR